MSSDPSRPRPDPKIDNKVPKMVNEVTEMDLWDMDLSHDSVPISPENVSRTPGQLPVKRQSESKIRSKTPSELKPASAETADSTVIILADTPANDSSQDKDKDKDDEVFAGFPDLEETQPEVKWEETENDPAVSTDSKPAPTIPAIGSLSRIEKIAISALCAVLALGATLTLIHFSKRVPTRPLVAEKIDYPVSGKIIEITAASTYWREPVTTGENADVVRRGSKLIPVLKLGLQSKSGAIRVFFRNEDGIVVGDGITLTVKGDAEVTVAATAGFEDAGMHTAYRTGDGKRWIVQIFEGPSATAPREQFRKVLETEVSTQIR